MAPEQVWTSSISPCNVIHSDVCLALGATTSNHKGHPKGYTNTNKDAWWLSPPII